MDKFAVQYWVSEDNDSWTVTRWHGRRNAAGEFTSRQGWRIGSWENQVAAKKVAEFLQSMSDYESDVVTNRKFDDELMAAKMELS